MHVCRAEVEPLFGEENQVVLCLQFFSEQRPETCPHLAPGCVLFLNGTPQVSGECDILSIACNQPQWRYLYHRNWQVLQTSVLPCPRWQLLNIFQHSLREAIREGAVDNTLAIRSYLFLALPLKHSCWHFPGGPVVKNPPCNEWDVGSILGQGTKTPHAVEQLQASLVGQQVKNPPAMQETRVQSLGQEDPLEKGMATQSSTPLPGEFREQRSWAAYSPWDCKGSDMTVWLTYGAIKSTSLN